MDRRNSWLVLAVALSLALPAPALAGKPNKPGKGKDKDKDNKVEVVVVFAPEVRESVRSYFGDKHGRGNCPPGLAKKNNGCLPPGQAKKRYAVGQPLPAGIVIETVPVELGVRIGPPPHGFRYGVIDGDLVKLAIGTALVVDAIDGLVD